MNLWTSSFLMYVTSSVGNELEENRLSDYDFIEMESGDNVTEFDNRTCTNDYCISDEAYVDLIADYLTPRGWYLVLIGIHATVFLGGIIGNSLVCIAVHRNHTMRNVTNYYIVNLAIADLMVIILCLPSTVLWDVTETWFLGNCLCKAIPYLQTVSVSVSILTLTFISIDRWYAICFPLKFKSTTKRAKRTILVIWIFSLIFDLIVLHTAPAPHLRVDTIFYTQCTVSWSQRSERIFALIKLVFLYGGPLLFMTFTYCSIIRVLWRSKIPGYQSSRSTPPITESTASIHENFEGQMASRRKAAKMLIVVVLVFGLCYLPVHILIVLRQTVGLPSNEINVTCSLIAHWLCYANSAMNPIIYNFMSGKFRKEFRRSFQCSPRGSNDRRIFKCTLPYCPPDPRCQPYRNIPTELNFQTLQVWMTCIKNIDHSELNCGGNENITCDCSGV
ncbi:orexin receptor type 1 isoform X2 [Fopius arisanus]|uniref:Orexin receptor type 1 isoform X2 n=1 Tax=Fopius arisanus TaxID=64838 RepID=A0A9R1THT3_9HYME|nr:PREDICTED: orexin receptor type 1-like isoform X2 [Fopius arisanus]